MSADCERVLMVIEDDRELRESIVEVLTDSSYEAIPAENGKEALEQLRAIGKRPCLILLDIMMPVMDGWEFRAQQEGDPALSTIPVVVITAHANARRAAEDMGAAGFLRKPLQLPQLLEAVEQHCGKG